MAGVTQRSTSISPAPAGDVRPLVVSSVNLACCAVEAASALTLWTQHDEVLHQVNPGLRRVIPLQVLVVAGTVTRANAHLVLEAYERLPVPRAVIAFGVCTISGGPYWDSYAVLPGIGELVPVDVFIPGCPPHPDDLSRVLFDLAAGSMQ